MSVEPYSDSPWPECQSSMVRGLEAYSDLELLQSLRSDPKAARYWVSLFCRYHPGVEAVLHQQVSSELIGLWRHRIWQSLYQQLLKVDPQPWAEAPQQWFDHQVRDLLQQAAATSPMTFPQGTATPDLEEISPILTCYLHLGLEELPADLRFVLVLSDRFRWSAAQISAQLQSEGYSLSPRDTQQLTETARQQLFQALPADVRALYLTSKP